MVGSSSSNQSTSSPAWARCNSPSPTDCCSSRSLSNKEDSLETRGTVSPFLSAEAAISLISSSVFAPSLNSFTVSFAPGSKAEM